MNRINVNFCGVEFKNPVIPASGTFGYGREYEQFYPLSKLGGISVKGTTLHRREGNPGPRVAETPSGMLNSVGLQNGGVDKFINYELPNLVTKDTRIIANIAGSTIEECAELAEKLNGTAVDFDKDAAVMSVDAATKSDDYSDWDFDIKNTARIQLINVYDNLAAIPNDTYESIKVTFTVTGLGGGEAAADDNTAAAEDTAPVETGADKGSPDTGVEGVAALAGIAVVAGGALVISRKRK